MDFHFTNLINNPYINMYSRFKRIFDFSFSLLIIIILFPLFIPLAIVLRFTGEGYIFYRQDRIGYRNKKFKIWKFATMLKASPGLGTGSITLRNDWRLTPLGKYLRFTKINEVPQIINILKGDMSFVGPRPLMEIDFLKFPQEVQPIFYNLRPGLTGAASVVFRDAEKYFTNQNQNLHEFDKTYIAPYKAELEIWYQKKISAITDIKLIILTAWVLVAPKNNLVYVFFKDLPSRPEQLK